MYARYCDIFVEQFRIIEVIYVRSTIKSIKLYMSKMDLQRQLVVDVNTLKPSHVYYASVNEITVGSSRTKINLKMSSETWRPFCVDLNVLSLKQTTTDYESLISSTHQSSGWQTNQFLGGPVKWQITRFSYHTKQTIWYEVSTCRIISGNTNHFETPSAGRYSWGHLAWKTRTRGTSSNGTGTVPESGISLFQFPVFK